MDAEATNDADWKGVCFNKRARRWQASIHIQRRYVYLGCYATRELAARAWDLVSLRVRKNTKTNLSRDNYFDQHGNLNSCPSLDTAIQILLDAEQQPEGAASDQTARGVFCAAVAAAVTGAPAAAPVAVQQRQGAVAKRQKTGSCRAPEPQTAAVSPRSTGNVQQQLQQQQLLQAWMSQQAMAQAGAAAGGTEWCGAWSSLASLAGGTPTMLGLAASTPAPAATSNVAPAALWHCGQPAAPAWAAPAAAPAPLNFKLPATRDGKSQLLPIQQQNQQLSCSGDSSSISEQLAATLVEQMLQGTPEEEQDQLLRDLLGMEASAVTPVAVVAAHPRAAGTTAGATSATTGEGPADTAACSAMLRHTAHGGCSPAAGGQQPRCAAAPAAVVADEPAGALVGCNSSSGGSSSRQIGGAGQLQVQVFDTRLLRCLLPPGSTIEQIRARGGDSGMFSIVFSCPREVTWGAGVWDGQEWHSLGTNYRCEADAVAASSCVME